MHSPRASQAGAPSAAPAVKQKAPHVIIVGAGCTGLLLAQGLKKAGTSFEIYESDAALTSPNCQEWGMTIHWSRPLLGSILPAELLSRLEEAQVDPSFDVSSDAGYTLPFYNGKTGEHIIAMPIANAVRVSRSKFRKLLSNGIDIQFGETIASCTMNGDQVTASFESGRTTTGTLLVGTDGPKSAVRSIIFGHEAAAVQQLPVIMYNLTVCYEDAARAQHIRHLHRLNTVALHPQRSLSFWTSIQDVRDPSLPETWLFQLMLSWLDDGKEHFGGAEGLAELKAIAQSLAEPWRSSILWIPENTKIPPPSRVVYWPTVDWDNKGGLITLAGDAAHPLPPHRGQGLNHCIQDIDNLLSAILSLSPSYPRSTSSASSAEGFSSSSYAAVDSPETSTQASVISAYQAEVVKRGAEEVEKGRKKSMLVHDFQKFMGSPALKQGYGRARSAEENAGSPLAGRVGIPARERESEDMEGKVISLDFAETKETHGEREEKSGKEEGRMEEKEQMELVLMREYRRKVNEMNEMERREMQIRLVGEIEGLSRQMAEKSRELSEILSVL